MTTQKQLEKQAKQIIKIAKKSGVEHNFFFGTTFERYMVQVKIASQLEKVINEDGALVTKEYVKGRENVYSHPAIKDYNRTTDSANKTVAILLKIISSFGEVDEKDDELIKFLKGN